MFKIRDNDNGKENCFETIEELSSFVAETFIKCYNENAYLPTIDYNFSYGDEDFSIYY